MIQKKAFVFKYFLYLIVAFVIFTYLHDVLKEGLESKFIDFGHYYICAQLLRERYDIWQWSAETATKTSTLCNELGLVEQGRPLHSPGFFFLFLPFTFLPYKIAVYLWLFLTQLALLVTIILILKRIRNLQFWQILSCLFLVFSYWPLREDLHLGQVNLLILFFLTACLFLTEKRFPFAAGFCLALGIQIKELFSPLVIFFLWKRNWRAVAGVVFGLVFLRIIPVFVFGIDKEMSYWKHLFAFFKIGKFYLSVFNLSLSAVVGRMGSGIIKEKLLWVIVWLINLLLLGKTLWLTNGRKQSFPNQLATEFSLFVVLCFLISPWVHETHYVVLYLPILLSWFFIAEVELRCHFFDVHNCLSSFRVKIFF